MYKQGDILLIPIPFSNLSSSKKRPVLVISKSEYNKVTDDVVVVAITSNVNEREYTVLISNEDLDEGNLKVDSIIRTDKIYTMSQDIVIKKFGKLKKEIISKVKNKIFNLIDEK